MPSTAHQWTNASVVHFAAGKDPLDRAHEVATELFRTAEGAGISGPPVDVFALAQHLGIGLRPKDDLLDAQVLAQPGTQPGALVIEYNPSRPRGRLRFSIAHEIAHSRFADVADRPRHRTAAGSVEASSTDDWELELLCDIIAADLLIPDRAVEGLLTVDPDIDFIMETRRKLDVSTEALLRRLVSATPRALVLLAASRLAGTEEGRMRIDYVVRSGSAGPGKISSLQHGDRLRDATPLLECSAVGQTARGTINLGGMTLYIQAVGIPAYPGSRWPRVLALLEPESARLNEPNLSFVVSDLLDVADTANPVLFAHVVSDASRRWGYTGVAGSLGKAFPDFAKAFRSWAIASPTNLRLGNVHFVDRPVEGRTIGVASLVAQEGFGGSSPRLRFDALEQSLSALAELAIARHAEVHVPRLGAGQAGGRWDSVEAALNRYLAQRGVKVVVHTQPFGPRDRLHSNA